MNNIFCYSSYISRRVVLENAQNLYPIFHFPSKIQISANKKKKRNEKYLI